MSSHGQRGQSLPVTAIGVIALIAMGLFSIDYANTVRWQIRAQSAADSAAQAVMSLQTQEFNEMTATLYAAAIEEYRIRRNLNAMAMAANYQGGCAAGDSLAAGSAGLVDAQGKCESVYLDLQPHFMRAVERYGQDVQLLNQITATLNSTNVTNDSQALISQLNTGCISGGTNTDCAFNYMIPATGIIFRSDTVAVKMDAIGIEKPWNATASTSPSGVNQKLLAPAQIEVEACATVPPIIPSFFGYTPKPNVVIGRAAATAVMTEQDWLQPGTNENPITGGVFQPAESYIAPTIVDTANGNYDWYDLNYGGNAVTAYDTPATQTTPAIVGYKAYSIDGDDFEAWLGWWNSVPIHTFVTGLETSAAYGCSS